MSPEKASSFQQKTNAKKKVCDGRAHERDCEAGGHKQPRDRADDCRDQYAKKNGIEDLLDTVRYTEDARLTWGNIKTRNSSREEHTRNNTNLSSNHDAGQIVSVAAVFLSNMLEPWSFAQNLASAKKAIRKAFKHADNTQEEKDKYEHSSNRRNAFPYGCLGLEQGSVGYCQSESRPCKVMG